MTWDEEGRTRVERVGTCLATREKHGVYSINGAPEVCVCDDQCPPDVLEAHLRWLTNGGDETQDELDRVHYDDGQRWTGRQAFAELADAFAAEHSLGWYAPGKSQIRAGSCRVCGLPDAFDDVCPRCERGMVA